jgi:hypothetical protein
MRARAFPGEDPQTLKPPSAVAEALVNALPSLGPGCARLMVDRDGAGHLS